MCPTPGKWSGSKFAWLRMDLGQTAAPTPSMWVENGKPDVNINVNLLIFHKVKMPPWGKQVIKEGMWTLACLPC